MKKIITILSAISLIFFLSACGGGDDNSQTTASSTEGESTTDEGAAPTTDESDMASKAICLWPTVGLRDKPGRSGAKYITGIKFGETVTLTGEEEEIESEKRTYLKMKLADDKEGWANEYLFAVGGKAAVAVAGIDVFKRPDLSTLTDKRITAGTMFTITPSEEKTGWAEINTMEKKISGWTQISDGMYTEDPTDIALGKVMAEVEGMKTTAEKIKRLKTVSSSPSFSGSSLMPMVTEMLENLDKSTNLPNTQLMITGNNVNVRSNPNTDEDNVIFQVNEGEIWEILERGEEMVEIGGSKDYWYMIEKNGQSGWIFGKFTSKGK